MVFPSLVGQEPSSQRSLSPAVPQILLVRAHPDHGGAFLSGRRPGGEPYVMLSQVFTAYYFLHFLVILPIISSIERPEPLPFSITEAVLHSDKKAVLGENAEPAV